MIQPLFRLPILVALMTLTFFFLHGCDNTVQKSGKKQVSTSFYLLADIAEKIVGEKMEVSCVMPAGTDVHSWEPTPRKVGEMIHADTFLMNGAGLESWTGKVLPQFKKRRIPVFVAAQSVTLSGTHDCGHDHHAHGHEVHHDCDHHEHYEHHDHHEHVMGQDPHIWLSLKNMRKIIGDLTVFLTELNPENGAFYAENAQKLLAECDTLDAEFQATTVTLKNRQLVVSHRAFGYLCQDYGLEQVALEGYSAYSDPSPAQMVKIVEFIRENQVPVIFADSSETRKGADAIARETGVKIAVLHPMGTLTEEQLKEGADYFSVMRENLEALKLLGDRNQRVGDSN